jgi:hypothetical protein
MKGQITLFMVLGLAILFLVAAALYMIGGFSSGDSRERVTVPPYIEACLESSLSESIEYYGSRWGERTRKYEEMAVPYGSFDSFNLIPSREEAKFILDELILSNFEDCYGGMEGTEELDIPAIQTVIGDATVTAMLYFPIRFTDEKSSSKFCEFESRRLVPLGSMLTLASSYVEEIRNQNIDLRTRDYSCSGIMLCQHEGIVRIYSYQDLDEKPYLFMFAIESEEVPGCTSVEMLAGGMCP